jgi:hypothetical protein
LAAYPATLADVRKFNTPKSAEINYGVYLANYKDTKHK